jgi:hypothetical protein
MAKRIVHLEHDSDLECPADMDCQWKLYSFCTRHVSFKHPDELGIVCNRNEVVRVRDRKLATKLRNGLAHVLSYFEHGQSCWFRKDGEITPGIEFQWDGVRVAGLLVWEHDKSEIGGKTFEERAKDADGFLKEYTSWANGEGYYYRIEDEDGDDVDSCGGFLGDPDYMLAEMVHSLVGHEFEVQGDADYLEGKLRALVKAKEAETATV